MNTFSGWFKKALKKWIPLKDSLDDQHNLLETKLYRMQFDKIPESSNLRWCLDWSGAELIMENFDSEKYDPYVIIRTTPEILDRIVKTCNPCEVSECRVVANYCK